MFSLNKKQLAILIDPDSYGSDKFAHLLSLLSKYTPDYIFVGGSITSASTEKAIESIKKEVNIPVIIFPGNASQFSPKADALLYLSLISGRNPDYLISQHVNSASYVKRSGISVIPVGYILIESGTMTSVEYISNTKPIPRNKTSIAVATAIAGEFLGQKAIYLEAGSGAQLRVPDKMINSVKQSINIPLIVGGGIRSAEEMKKVFQAGADLVVIGNALEDNTDLLSELIQTLVLL